MCISHNMEEVPWCVLGDFIVVLYKGHRIGGVEVPDGEIRDYANCLLQCGLHEFNHT